MIISSIHVGQSEDIRFLGGSEIVFPEEYSRQLTNGQLLMNFRLKGNKFQTGLKCSEFAAIQTIGNTEMLMNQKSKNRILMSLRCRLTLCQRCWIHRCNKSPWKNERRIGTIKSFEDNVLWTNVRFL